MRTRVKICCIASEAEARLAMAHGADAIGLVAEMPSGPGPIPDAEIRAIAAGVPAGIATFLLTARAEATAIVAHARFCATTTVQLVDEVARSAYAEIREALPELKIVQVLHVGGEETVEAARRVAPLVDAILLDSGRPDGAVKELGGTGRVHDWQVSARVVEAIEGPVFLAGGLKPENVAEAIRTVRPYGVDLCSGVRTDGALDGDRLAAFMAAVQQA
ncbi:MAG: phosphoribosylanthranilate isomerase [Alphaproteobacteria bacterium]|jgi:phosphoribosylanthranilate isomerase|nr:phosphoribosylanthranilate isomerase [Alphaproteobacteria bacterium]